jgi:chemotaxis signal transduction protein
VPLAPALLLGVTQLRGRILAVIDAAPLVAPAPGQGEVGARPGEGGMPALVVTAGGKDAVLALRVTEIVGFEHPSPALAAGGPPRWRDEEVAVLDVAALVARLRPAAARPGGAAWPWPEEVAER